MNALANTSLESQQADIGSIIVILSYIDTTISVEMVERAQSGLGFTIAPQNDTDIEVSLKRRLEAASIEEIYTIKAFLDKLLKVRLISYNEESILTKLKLDLAIHPTQGISEIVRDCDDNISNSLVRDANEVVLEAIPPSSNTPHQIILFFRLSRFGNLFQIQEKMHQLIQ